ncbi:MAG TPA: putative Ig domain-containing protein [Chitinophagaceae bacterium]|nr:putative Ig domain-containing protein [Chitinophagaceae bacterium]
MRNFFLFLTCCACFTALSAQQRIDMPEARFKTGDNKNYSQQSFDDSKWQTLKTSEAWDEQGYKDYDGYGWYRIHVTIPSSLKSSSYWKDTLRINLAKIDDADEVYLNGKLIGKEGAFPSDPGGYVSKWSEPREYHLGTNDSLIRWDAENIIAVKVYDGGGLGGIYSGTPFITMMDLIDAIKLSFRDSRTGENDKLIVPVVLTNNILQSIPGLLKLWVTDSENGKIIKSEDRELIVTFDKNIVAELEVPKDKRYDIEAQFIEGNTKKSVSIHKVTPYILTPLPPSTPRINGATVFGVRPGSPFLFKIPATGQKPLFYSVQHLPAGLKVDSATGIITGKLLKAGTYKMNFVVKNSLGEASEEFTVKCGNLLSLTPPMGWNSWNCWGLSVSEDKVISSAQALINKGLIDHGWTYMNIDDGWEAEKRNDKGEIVPNSKFPDMKVLGNWLHDHGLKFGIYSSPGPRTCGGYLGSWQHEKQDATTYASWGIDYLKYDWCSYQSIAKGDTSLAAYEKPYKVMQVALRSQKRDIHYSLCQYGMKKVWEWGDKVDGNCWRTTGDITDNWNSLSGIGFNQTVQYKYAKPGRWNDPDMLIVGMVGWGENLHQTGLTPDEQYTHISLWCLLSAPLLIGCDISKMDDFTVNLLTNDEVLALDQDPLGKQAYQAIKKDNYQVWMKDLGDGSKAIGIFNLEDSYQAISVSSADLGIDSRSEVRDLWRQKNLGAFGFSFTTRVPPHGVTLIKVQK